MIELSSRASCYFLVGELANKLDIRQLDYASEADELTQFLNVFSLILLKASGVKDALRIDLIGVVCSDYLFRLKEGKK